MKRKKRVLCEDFPECSIPRAELRKGFRELRENRIARERSPFGGTLSHRGDLERQASVVDGASSNGYSLIGFDFARQQDRPMDWREYIVVDPAVLAGKPVVRGTRIGVGFLLELFAAGWTREQVVENYPGITSEALSAVFAYARECVLDGALQPLRQGVA